jgi:hypothetical protein
MAKKDEPASPKFAERREMWKADPEAAAEAGALFAALPGLGRKGWGDHTVLTICATNCDDQGNFEVGVFDEDDTREPVFEPVRCNVNDHDDEIQRVMDTVIDFYLEWQAERGSNA